MRCDECNEKVQLPWISEGTIKCSECIDDMTLPRDFIEENLYWPIGASLSKDAIVVQGNIVIIKED